MKKYLHLLGILIIVWIIVQSANIFIVYQEQNIFDLSPLKEWKPWSITFIVFLLYYLVRDWISKSR